jgi:hypothetical protein
MDNSTQTQQIFPAPLERLNIYNGLSINAQRWEIAHSYHRNRQNTYFQSLFEPGIVSGLGIQILTDPPENAGPPYDQKNRWIRIQSGIAIDNLGNPIIIDAEADQSTLNQIENPRNFYIETDPLRCNSGTMHIVLSFAEPSFREEVKGDTLPEQFRIDQKTEKPAAHEIELCRVFIQTDDQGQVELKYPCNVFDPGPNELDLRYRQSVQLAPREFVRIGVLENANPSLYKSFEALSESLPALYPTMRSCLMSVQDSDLQESLALQCDVLCMGIEQLSELYSGDSWQKIAAFVKAGGAMLVDVSTASNDRSLMQQVCQALHQPYPLESWQSLKLKEHFLLNTPFQFSLSPNYCEVDSQLYLSYQLIWVKGPLTAAWRGAGEKSRERIRSSQELGINLLRYIWRFRQLSPYTRSAAAHQS